MFQNHEQFNLAIANVFLHYFGHGDGIDYLRLFRVPQVQKMKNI